MGSRRRKRKHLRKSVLFFFFRLSVFKNTACVKFIKSKYTERFTDL